MATATKARKSASKTASKSVEPKADIRETITNKIIAAIEGGTLPWAQPWKSPSRPLRVCGTPYSGVNVIMLWATSLEHGYTSSHWMTFNQAIELGACVRKGEKGTQVIYASAIVKEETDDKGDKTEKSIPFLKSYYVFNCDQIDGLPEKFYAKPQSETRRIEDVDSFFANTKQVVLQAGEASYSIKEDVIRMPQIDSFVSTNDYYAVLSHETIHWTRHESRLARDMGRKQWGDEGYAMEELVAELGAAFLCADLGLTIANDKQSAAYIQSWLKVLKNDKQAIFTAASHASKAVEFLHSMQPTKAE